MIQVYNFSLLIRVSLHEKIGEDKKTWFSKCKQGWSSFKLFIIRQIPRIRTKVNIEMLFIQYKYILIKYLYLIVYFFKDPFNCYIIPRWRFHPYWKLTNQPPTTSPSLEWAGNCQHEGLILNGWFKFVSIVPGSCLTCQRCFIAFSMSKPRSPL